MITTTLLNITNLLIGWFLSGRPVWQPTVPPSVSTLISFDLAYDSLLPINEMLTCIGLICTLLIAMVTLKWGVKIVDWVADVIP